MKLEMPCIQRREIVVPHPVRALVSRGFKGSVWINDIDRNELPANDPYWGAGKPTVLRGPELLSTLSFLRQGGKLTYVTGSTYEHQLPRVIEPIKEELTRSGELELMQSVALYSSRGAVQVTFLQNGEINEQALARHTRRYGIAAQDIPQLEEVVQEAIEKYWTRYTADESYFHELYPHIGRWMKPDCQKRAVKIGDKEIVGQLSALPFPHNELLGAVDFIRSRLKGDIAGRNEVNRGGRTTVDINRRGVSKELAIRTELRRLGIPLVAERNTLEDLKQVRHTVLYGGDEIQVLLDEKTSLLIEGNDAVALRIPNVFILASNASSHGIPLETGRTIHIGSGPEATHTLRRYAVTHWGRPLEEMPEKVETPFLEQKEIEVPPQVEDVVSERFNNAMLVLSTGSLVGFTAAKDLEKSVLVERVIVQICDLVKKGVPIVIIDQGDHETRVIPIYQALRRFLGVDSNLKVKRPNLRLLFYSNAGALLTAVDENGEWNRSIFEEHSERFMINTEYHGILEEILNGLKNEYVKLARENHALKYSQNIVVERRSGGAQFALFPVLSVEMGWLINLFHKRLQEKGLAGKFLMHESKETLHVTRAKTDIRCTLSDALARFDLHMGSPIIYIGEDFGQSTDAKTGQDRRRFDMGALGFQGLFALGINENQDDIRRIIDAGYSGIIPAGSGRVALEKWLYFFNKSLKKG